MQISGSIGFSKYFLKKTDFSLCVGKLFRGFENYPLHFNHPNTVKYLARLFLIYFGHGTVDDPGHYIKAPQQNLSFVVRLMTHIGGQVLHPKNLRKSSELVMHNKGFHYISLLLLCVTRSEDFLKLL